MKEAEILRRFGVILLTISVCAASLYYFAWQPRILVDAAEGVSFDHADLGEEPFFADESACLAQTYYYRLGLSGRWNDPDWLHPASYDYPAFGKYVWGAAISLAGKGARIPTTTQPWEAWMGGDFSPPQDRTILLAARWSMTIAAAAGVTFAFLLGRQLIGPTTGLMFAVFLGGSHLYVVHARRAMGDDLVQALVLASFYFFALAAQSDQRHRPKGVGAWLVGAGIAAAWAGATKLNGLVAMLTLGATLLAAAAGALLLSRPWKVRAIAAAKGTLATVLFAGAAAAAFIAVQPYLFAKVDPHAFERAADGSASIHGRRYPREAIDQWEPVARMGMIERFRHMLDHRVQALEESVDRFPNDQLRSADARAWAIVDQGMGRWTLMGQTPVPTAVGGVAVLGLCVVGICFAWSDGWGELTQGRWPVAWILIFWPVVEIGQLMRGLMLNWDRYYLGIVVAASALVAYALGAGGRRIFRRMVLAPPTSETAT